MTDHDPNRDELAERLDADEPGAPPGFLLDPDDQRAPTCCCTDPEHDHDHEHQHEATP